METVRIVLTEPFIKHPAGLVFELDAAQGVSGWDDDSRVRERLNFSDKRNYRLPDGGNGLPYELPLSAVKPCPEAVFQGVDLRSGPVRITESLVGTSSENMQKTNVKFDAGLSAVDGVNAQCIQLPLLVFQGKIRTLTFQNILSQAPVQTCAHEDNGVLLNELSPGFYQLDITLRDGTRHLLRVIKSFPLLVIFSGNSGQYSVQKTLY